MSLKICICRWQFQNNYKEMQKKGFRTSDIIIRKMVLVFAVSFIQMNDLKMCPGHFFMILPKNSVQLTRKLQLHIIQGVPINMGIRNLGTFPKDFS